MTDDLHMIDVDIFMVATVFSVATGFSAVQVAFFFSRVIPFGTKAKLIKLINEDPLLIIYMQISRVHVWLINMKGIFTPFFAI